MQRDCLHRGVVSDLPIHNGDTYFVWIPCHVEDRTYITDAVSPDFERERPGVVVMYAEQGFPGGESGEARILPIESHSGRAVEYHLSRSVENDRLTLSRLRDDVVPAGR